MIEPRIPGMSRFFIFGDSHAGTLMRAAKSLALDFAGGSIMAGFHMNEPFFKVNDGRFVMTTKLGRERLRFRLDQAELSGNFLDIDLPILSTVGFNTTNFSMGFVDSEFAIRDTPGKRLISMACFRAVVEASRKDALDFYRALAGANKHVFAVLSPQRFTPNNLVVSQAFNKIMVDLVSAIGVKVIDVGAETSGSNGVLLPEFASPDDHVHGNDAFGEAVFRWFAEMLAPTR